MQRLLSIVVTCAIAFVPAAMAGGIWAAELQTTGATANTASAQTSTAGGTVTSAIKTTTTTAAQTTTTTAAQTNVTTTTAQLSPTTTTVTTTSVATTGNGAPSGAHYNLNIIGVPKAKTADMSGSNGHVLFVNLSGNTKINLSPGPYDVLDANGTDGVAAFQLPIPDPDGDGVTAYSVYARALGKPDGGAVMTSCVTDFLIDGTLGSFCSTENVILMRTSGKQTFDNVSKQLLTVCLDTTGDGVCDLRTSLFSDVNAKYAWDYDNTGLRLAQLRFYPVSASNQPQHGPR